uniref:Uncharacterized protein n=1 Tax=Anguilla anguilla TaxID=7936 RepID=A0A0E9TNG1_ANGAN
MSIKIHFNGNGLIQIPIPFLMKGENGVLLPFHCDSIMNGTELLGAILAPKQHALCECD